MYSIGEIFIIYCNHYRRQKLSRDISRDTSVKEARVPQTASPACYFAGT